MTKRFVLVSAIAGWAAIHAAAQGPVHATAAKQSSVTTFASAEEAADALIHATQNDDTAALSALFGPRAKRVLTSGDAARDKQERAEFGRLAAGNHHLEADPMNRRRMVLAVGTQDWPFPIPIVQKNGTWSFDPESGEQEMHARRIGANELNTIEICAGYVEAQQAYAAQVPGPGGMREYAQHVMSLPGRKDGLFWQISNGGAAPLVPKRFAEASLDPRNPASASPVPYHGYLFHVLKSQGPNAPQGARSYVVKDAMIGGFGLVAWPAEYGVTGVHTFIVDQDGSVYERDLGPSTALTARNLKQFDPDRRWTLVE